MSHGYRVIQFLALCFMDVVGKLADVLGMSNGIDVLEPWKCATG